MKQVFKRVFALVMTLCMLTIGTGAAMAQAQDGADLEALYPLMDLVCAAAADAAQDDYAIVIPNSEGELAPAFVDAFIRLGQTRGQSLGVTKEMMGDTMAQAGYLSTVFAAQLPTLSAVVETEASTQYIGFHPVTVNAPGTDGTIQIVGETYIADKPLGQMSDEELVSVRWLDRAIFTFQSDSSALNGFRLMGFSSGTELNMEAVMQGYFEEIVVEYVNTKLGFTLLYPAVFDDDMLKEDDSGVSAELPDKSAAFFARRIDNTDKSELKSYVEVIAGGLKGAKSSISEELNCGTVSYLTDDGYIVFDVYVVTEKYIYQAELRYQKGLSKDYSMYNAYLENSFVADDVAAG